jgi:gamma-glutamyltranspeptidase/glutathione hydrolase
MYPTPRAHRPLIMGRNGAVGANHPMAAQVGLDTLRAGGNAVDASVAISLAPGVCEPMMSGLGGDQADAQRRPRGGSDSRRDGWAGAY